MKGYEHVKCKCGGIIGMYDNKTFTCERCKKEYELSTLEYDTCLSNYKTGWIFPMIKFSKGE